MKHTPAIRAWVIAGAIGLVAGITQPASTADAATVSFYDDGVDNEAASTGHRFDVGCFSDSTMATMVDCSGALIDVAGLTSNLFDTNDTNGLVGDMTLNSNVDTDDPGDGVSAAEELLFVQNYVGDPTLDWNGLADTTDAGGAGSFGFFSTALYFVFTVGTDPRYGLLRNDSGAPLWIQFDQIEGQGAGLSHYAEIGVIPIPATLPLFLTGLLGFGFLARRRRQAMEA